jgi:anti-sigma factor RsiW
VTCQDVERLQGAYLDGELDLEQTLALEAHTADCAACTARIEADRALSRALSAAPYFTAPADVVAAIRATTSRGRAVAPPARPAWGRWVVPLASAAVLLLAVAGTVRWRATVLADATRNAVVASHVRALMGEHLLDVPSTDRHTVKPWFAGRLEFSPTVPDLADEGFPLTGGRLDYVDGHAAAALVYKRGGHAIDVFTWPESAAEVAPRRSVDSRGYVLVSWTRHGFAWWAVSDVTPGDLDQFVAALRRGIDRLQE